MKNLVKKLLSPLLNYALNELSSKYDRTIHELSSKDKARSKQLSYQPYIIEKLLSLKSDTSKIWLVDLCSHNNIGDMAINLSELIQLKKWLVNYEIIPIVDIHTDKYLSLLKSAINATDIIIIHGGGNFGDLWFQHEIRRRLIIKHFPDNLIISFPQSTHYNSNIELEISKQCYQQHSKLVLCARDQRTYSFMQEHFSNNIIVRTYDIVLSYQHTFNFTPNYQQDILYLLRNDKEKATSLTLMSDLASFIPDGSIIKESDMINTSHPNYGFDDQFNIFYDKLLDCYQSKLIITDRLHGAIFALLVGTPVIVYDNSYKKVSSALAELRQKLPSNYLIFAEETILTPELIRTMLALPKNTQLPYQLLASEFSSFSELITQYIMNKY